MDWRDDGILLDTRPHGETSARIEVLTAAHGRHAGMVRGGASRRMAPMLQPGAQLDLTWRARLADHLGNFTAELIRPRFSLVLDDRLALAALTSTCALCRFALPERQPCPGLYAATRDLLDALGQPGWLRSYARWELLLLEDTGFGLDLSACAVTGATGGLAYVSPRTGRAVTRAGAGTYAARLLPLPPGLLGDAAFDHADARAALHLTGYFLHHRLAEALSRPLPEARARLVAALG